MTLQQLEKTFDSPPPVVPQSNPIGPDLVPQHIGQQGPLSHDVTLIVEQTGDHQTHRQSAAGNIILLALDTGFMGTMKHNVGFRNFLPNRPSVIQRLTDVCEENLSIEGVGDLRDQPRFAFPKYSTIVTADE